MRYKKIFSEAERAGAKKSHVVFTMEKGVILHNGI
jgi:hypothetical protein